MIFPSFFFSFRIAMFVACKSADRLDICVHKCASICVLHNNAFPCAVRSLLTADQPTKNVLIVVHYLVLFDGKWMCEG